MDKAITITAGGRTFSATLVDSPTTAAFKAVSSVPARLGEVNGIDEPSQQRAPAASGSPRLYQSSVTGSFALVTAVCLTVLRTEEAS